jgi:hypothetical protein
VRHLLPGHPSPSLLSHQPRPSRYSLWLPVHPSPSLPSRQSPWLPSHPSPSLPSYQSRPSLR